VTGGEAPNSSPVSFSSPHVPLLPATVGLIERAHNAMLSENEASRDSACVRHAPFDH
jgi:hypothetical protein